MMTKFGSVRSGAVERVESVVPFEVNLPVIRSAAIERPVNGPIVDGFGGRSSLQRLND